MAEERLITRSEKIAADIRRLKQKRCGLSTAIDALETLCVEALLLESGCSKKATDDIMELYRTLETETEE